MQELIKKLQVEHGLDPQKSHQILNTIKNFIVEKFPMVGGAVENLFGSDNTGTTATGDTGNTEAPAQKGGSFLDKISDFIPGDMGEKAEKIAKDNLGGMFGNKK